MTRFSFLRTALRELGLRQLLYYAWYQLGLRSGYLHWKTDSTQRIVKSDSTPHTLHPLFNIPDPQQFEAILGKDGAALLIDQANEIVNGNVRLFGGGPVPLRITEQGNLAHWTEYKSGERGVRGKGNTSVQDTTEDIKIIWEPGRFGWAYTLARAYLVSEDEVYSKTFWRYTETFLQGNMPNCGPHWISAQEVALRLIALTFASQAFATSKFSTPKRSRLLVQAIAAHAARIPPTLSYARAQNNNHLLSESAGLYTAGCALPDHPSAQEWLETGWRWFNQGLQDQIAEDGTYIQHSTNYQRLMLQLALWMNALATPRGERLPDMTLGRLQSATRWLAALVDYKSGHVPNLGPNDGAYILPLTVCPFEDYRPALQAAGIAFLNERFFPPGTWDEMTLWFGGREKGLRDQERSGERGKGKGGKESQSHYPLTPIPLSNTPHILRSTLSKSWAYFRAAHFISRPGHADQLHLDLWWQGINIACDPGTYLYNASSPWDNALTHTAVHNTLTINDLDQMTPAGRFLYLGWAQAEVLDGMQNDDGTWRSITARHDGYKRLGVIHQRAVTANEDGSWLVEDLVEHTNPPADREEKFATRLHWLLPDYPWEIDGTTLRMQSPHGSIILEISVGQNTLPPSIQLVCTGELLHGAGPIPPTWGTYSPTYGTKLPSLSFSITISGMLPLTMTSKWVFPDVEV